MPSAPGGNFLLGNALQLAGNACPWGKMLEWVTAAGPCVRIRIGARIGLVVGDPAAMKRIFQVRVKRRGEGGKAGAEPGGFEGVADVC